MDCFRFLPIFCAKFARCKPPSLSVSAQLRTCWLISIVLLAGQATVADATKSHDGEQRPTSKQPVQCLSTGDGYLRARLSGAINSEIDWHNKMNCEGSVRPGGGLRLRFSEPANNLQHPLVLLFGIKGIDEGKAGNVLAVNITIMREGRGEFYSTQGDKCIVDSLTQTILPGMPTRKRSYRVEARGFCNQPAPALNGKGSVLVTRFDFVGRVDVTADDNVAATIVRS